MALLPILEFPDPRLRTKAVPVTDFGPELQRLIDNMFETMYAAPGIGLAATQVDVHIQLMVVDISEEKDAQLVLINPQLSEPEGGAFHKEGCLSVPTVFAEVKRAERIRVQAQDRFGVPLDFVADEWLSVCIQHEMDHLIGKVFVDYMSPLKRAFTIRTLTKLKRERELKQDDQAA